MTCILVTRAMPGAEESAARLSALGYQPVLSPVIDLVVADPLPEMNVEAAAGVIFTSANGVRFFCDASDVRGKPAWCVGPATLAAAEAAGFSTCHTADGNAADLAALIRSNASPVAGPLLHVANEEAAGELASTLQAAGFDVRFAPLYRPVAARQLTSAAKTAFQAEAIRAVLLHSAKGAAAFAALSAGLGLRRIKVIAISDAALAPAAGLGWQNMIVAKRPNEDALMAALSRAETVL